MIRTASALLLLLPFATPALAQRAAPTGGFASPFERLVDSGPREHTLLAFEPEAVAPFEEAHRRGAPSELLGLALPGGDTVDLVLRPIDLWEAGGTAIVVGPEGRERRMAPSVQLFSVGIPERAGSGFLGVSREMLHGYLELDGERYVLSTGERPGLPLAVAHADALANGTALGIGAAEFCGVVSTPTGEPADTDGAGEPDELRAANPKLLTTKVFLECDKRFRDRFASTQAVIDYATLLAAATSEIYRRDIGCELTLPNGYLRVWESTPPWGNTSTFGDLSKFINWWASSSNTQSGVARAQVHLLSYPVFGGVANGIGVTCSIQNSYAISSCYGSFPYPLQHTNGGNWDLVVFAHESGHLYGSEHTFDYSPPIDCDDGSGPDKGTIMSYCHQTYGVVGIGLRFHLRVQDNIRGDIGAKQCAVATILKRGDYTADGTVDGADLAAFDVVDTQGFRSRAAEEVFDLDGDGDMDANDRVILYGKANFAKASSTVHNGSGVNCAWCYTSITEPVIGETWSTFVGGFFGPPILTTIYGATGKLATPVGTPYGEVLISLTGFGGATIFKSNVMTNGQYAQHDNPIPFDASFLGVTVETQAVLFKPSGVELANGMTLYVSSY